MKGLLIKDLKLLKSQKLFITIIAVICCYFVITEKLQFAMTYAAIIFSMLVISTVNYDDDKNGMSFILTFPISRKMYVLEKYVLGMLFMAVILAAESIMMMAATAVKAASYAPYDWLSAILSFLLSSSLVLSATLPFQIKYGAEKGRMVLVTVFICMGIAAYSLRQVFKALNIDLTAVIEKVTSAGALEVAIFTIALSFGMMAVSYLLSAAAIKRKQF